MHQKGNAPPARIAGGPWESCSFFAEVNSDGAGGVDQFTVGINGLHFSDGLGDIDELDFAAAQRHHLHEAALGDEVDGGDSEAGAEDAIVGRGRTAALGVAENGNADFLFGANRDGFADQVADADAFGDGAVALDAVAGGSAREPARLRPGR